MTLLNLWLWPELKGMRRQDDGKPVEVDGERAVAMRLACVVRYEVHLDRHKTARSRNGVGFVGEGAMRDDVRS